MISFIFGLFLLAVPFILVGLFSDKNRGFVSVLFFCLLFQSLLGIATQFSGLFCYNVVVGITILVDVIIVLTYLKIKWPSIISKKKSIIDFKKINWVILAVAVISIFSLFQVHYNYTGKISLVSDKAPFTTEVKEMKYAYPYFSDEWYAIALVNSSIDSHSLPITNTLDGLYFENLEIFFHSFVAEMIVILELDCLTQYTLLSIFINTVIILLIYLLLRINNVSRLAAGICSLLALYITNGSNLPGLWNLIPANLGILFSLIGFYFLSLNDWKMSFLSLLLTALFYPPLVIFSAIGFLMFLFGKSVKNRGKVFTIIGCCSVLAILVTLLVINTNIFLSLKSFLNYGFSRIFFVSLVAPYIPQINFYYVIPFLAILLSFFGFYPLYRDRKWFLIEFICACFTCFVYSLTVNRFFIEYERVVFLVSIMTIIIAGFGLKYLEESIKIRFKEKGAKIFKIAGLLILLVFSLLILVYTKGGNWEKIIAVNPNSKVIAYPRAPANYYFTQNDAEIFKDIKDKWFLSVPWKGTVIGVATANHPILIKEGTIVIGNVEIVSSFLNFDCNGKRAMAKQYNLDYIYLNEFNCQGFDRIGESDEGFILYKYNNQ